MKHINVVIVTILFLSTTHIVAQTADDPWQIGLSFNAVDVYPTGADGMIRLPHRVIFLKMYSILAITGILEAHRSL